MNEHDATETAYKNGYRDAVREMRAKLIHEWNQCAYDADEAPDVIDQIAKEMLESKK